MYEKRTPIGKWEIIVQHESLFIFYPQCVIPYIVIPDVEPEPYIQQLKDGMHPEVLKALK